jgi:hypothetical protein
MSRGSFPKGSRGEQPAQRRERYEQWLIATAGSAKTPDHELNAVTFYRGLTTSVSAGPGSTQRKIVPKLPSPGLCVTARCWQCVAGPDEPSAQDLIAACRRPQCGLYPVRPYQDTPEKTGRAAAKAAIRAECLDCARGNSNEVRLCHSVTCALWPARSGASGFEANEQKESET